MNSYPRCLACGKEAESRYFPDGFHAHDYVSWFCSRCGHKTTVGTIQTFTRTHEPEQKTLI